MFIPFPIRLSSSCDVFFLIEVSRSNAPDGHVGTRDRGQLDGAGETLVTLGVVVLQTDLKLNGLVEVTLLLIERVVEKVLDILAHSGCEEGE